MFFLSPHGRRRLRRLDAALPRRNVERAPPFVLSPQEVLFPPSAATDPLRKSSPLSSRASLPFFPFVEIEASSGSRHNALLSGLKWRLLSSYPPLGRDFALLSMKTLFFAPCIDKSCFPAFLFPFLWEIELFSSCDFKIASPFSLNSDEGLPPLFPPFPPKACPCSSARRKTSFFSLLLLS